VELLDENGKQSLMRSREVTITTFGVEGMPLLRYRTGDMCISHSDVVFVHVVRHSMRLSPVRGREAADDYIKRNKRSALIYRHVCV
jgi:phenylacetate-CoA ligase